MQAPDPGIPPVLLLLLPCLTPQSGSDSPHCRTSCLVPLQPTPPYRTYFPHRLQDYTSVRNSSKTWRSWPSRDPRQGRCIYNSPPPPRNPPYLLLPASCTATAIIITSLLPEAVRLATIELIASRAASKEGGGTFLSSLTQREPGTGCDKTRRGTGALCRSPSLERGSLRDRHRFRDSLRGGSVRGSGACCCWHGVLGARACWAGIKGMRGGEREGYNGRQSVPPAHVCAALDISSARGVDEAATQMTLRVVGRDLAAVARDKFITGRRRKKESER